MIADKSEYGAIIMDVVVWLRSLGLGKYVGKLGVPRVYAQSPRASHQQRRRGRPGSSKDALGIESDDVRC